MLRTATWYQALAHLNVNQKRHQRVVLLKDMSQRRLDRERLDQFRFSLAVIFLVALHLSIWWETEFQIKVPGCP